MTIYPKKRNSRFYRKLWEQHHGCPIPKDEFGRSYDIHHIDGDITNNSIENLLAVSIQEHYDIHFKQEEWYACQLIAIRMKKSPELISELISKSNKKRVAEGTHHWCGKSNLKKFEDKIWKETIFIPAQLKGVANTDQKAKGEKIRKIKNDPVWKETIGKEASKKQVANTDYNKVGKNISKTIKSQEWKKIHWKTCEHCEIRCNPVNYLRWHGDRCKKINNRKQEPI